MGLTSRRSATLRLLVIVMATLLRTTSVHAEPVPLVGEGSAGLIFGTSPTTDPVGSALGLRLGFGLSAAVDLGLSVQLTHIGFDGRNAQNPDYRGTVSTWFAGPLLRLLVPTRTAVRPFLDLGFGLASHSDDWLRDCSVDGGIGATAAVGTEVRLYRGLYTGVSVAGLAVGTWGACDDMLTTSVTEPDTLASPTVPISFRLHLGAREQRRERSPRAPAPPPPPGP